MQSRQTFRAIQIASLSLLRFTRRVFSQSVLEERVASSSVGIVTGYGLEGSLDRIPVGTRFSACPDRPWGPSSLLYNGYRVFRGGKVRPRRTAHPSPPSSAAVMEEYSYTSTPLWSVQPVQSLRETPQLDIIGKKLFIFGRFCRMEIKVGKLR